MTEELTHYNATRDAEISAGIRELVTASGENSRDHGFHDDWPKPRRMPFDSEIEQNQIDIRRAIAEKLALIHEEISEALGEIRSGRDPLETYFVSKESGQEYTDQGYDADGVPQYKPEGFLVELADAMIRIGDLAYLVRDTDGSALAEARRIKAEYNASREHKHGRKF